MKKILLIIFILTLPSCYDKQISQIEEIASDTNLKELIYFDKIRIESLIKGEFGDKKDIYLYVEQLKMDGKSSCQASEFDASKDQMKYCELMCKSINLEKKLIDKYGNIYLDNYKEISTIFYKSYPNLKLFSNNISNN